MKTKFDLRVSAERFVGMRAMADGSLLRNATFQDKQYVVVPIVSAVGDRVWWPANAPKPELVPATVLAANAVSRNNRPVVMGHPRVSGEYVSANAPDILEKYAFGFMFNSLFDDGRIKVEAWLDVARAAEVGPAAVRAIERFQAGEMVEVSEGNMVVTVAEEGKLNDQSYSAKWVLATNDHLAILGENEIGACDNVMGCGGPRVAAQNDGIVELVAAAMTQARTPSYTGTESTAWSRPSFADYVKYLDNSATPPVNVNQCSTDLKAKIAAHSLLGDAGAKSLNELAVFPVVNPANDKLNERALRAVLSGRGAPADIDPKALASAQEIARRLLNSEFSAGITASEANMKENLFARMIAKIRSAMSNNTLRWNLYQAIKELEPGVQYVDDEDVAAGTFRYVVMVCFGYSWEDDSERQYHTYQRSFTVNEADNTVTIGDNRIELMYDETKAWVEVPAASTVEPAMPEMEATFAPCGCKDKDNHEKGEIVMSVTAAQKALASRLITSSAAPFDESDRPTLEAMPEEKLTKLADSLDPPASEPVAAAPATPAVASAAAPAAVTIPADEYAAIKAAADTHAGMVAARKGALVGALKTAQSGFAEADLAAMELPMLEKMATAFKVDQPATADFSIRGVPASALGVSEADRIKSHAPTDTWGNARRLKANAGKQDAAN